MVTLDKEMIHFLDGMGQGEARFHQVTQNGLQFKTDGLFISGIFHLIFLDCGLPWVTETAESKTMVKGGYCSW